MHQYGEMSANCSKSRGSEGKFEAEGEGREAVGPVYEGPKVLGIWGGSVVRARVQSATTCKGQS